MSHIRLKTSRLLCVLLATAHGLALVPKRGTVAVAAYGRPYHATRCSPLPPIALRQHPTAPQPRASTVVCSAALRAAAAQGAAASGSSFWQLLTAFTLGGLFFSSAIAAAGALYAFGQDNVRRALSLMLVVTRRVFALLTDVLVKAKLALVVKLPDDDTTDDAAVKGFG